MPLREWLDRLRFRPGMPVMSGIAPDPSVQRVLVTGAAGGVASQLLPLLRDHVPQWRLTDVRDGMPSGYADVHVRPLGSGHDAGDLFHGVDAVVHLAGQAKPASVDVLQQRNVDTTAWLLRGMHAAGVRRLVYASSMHTMGGYRRDEPVTPAREPRPSDAYGASKVETERLIAEAADSWGLQALVLRIGHVMPTATDSEPGNWLATDDLARLVMIGVHRAAPGMTIVHAVTPHPGDDMGQRAIADSLGMTWRTDAPPYRDAMQRVASWYGADPVARELRGGVFASGRA